MFQTESSGDLVRCLTEGCTLFLTHVDVDRLACDDVYKPVILARDKFSSASTTFKLLVCVLYDLQTDIRRNTNNA